MTKNVVHSLQNIAVVFTTAIFFSCTNNVKEVRDFLADKNLPIGEAYQVSHRRTDSGRVDIRMKAPVMLDFSNRSAHPYSAFPQGLEITTIKKNGDSITIRGDYARTYTKTQVSEIEQNVVIYNHAQAYRLETNQLFWDQRTQYFFTEREFTFYTPTDTLSGIGFEASEQLEQWWVKNQRGVLEVTE
ncbi:MAG: LPS export ABC transporter periplasmic protein LptC [Lutibacter sp.]|jgi:LPS export ABC transporter protein LptC|nr:LPS export ABC transporter periplasmic protein LptC [Lutibacter sp.]